MVLTVTDKFSKRVTLISGRATFTAKQWADVLLLVNPQFIQSHDFRVIQEADLLLLISLKHQGVELRLQ